VSLDQRDIYTCYHLLLTISVQLVDTDSDDRVHRSAPGGVDPELVLQYAAATDRRRNKSPQWSLYMSKQLPTAHECTMFSLRERM